MQHHPLPLLSFFSVALSLVLPSIGLAQSKLPTIEQALEMSRGSGAPILAMAGQET